MSCWVLYNQSLVSLNPLQDSGFFDRPLSNVCPLLISLRVFLLCMRWLPSRFPIIGELFKEGCFDIWGLWKWLVNVLRCGKALEESLALQPRKEQSYSECGLLSSSRGCRLYRRCRWLCQRAGWIRSIFDNVCAGMAKEKGGGVKGRSECSVETHRRLMAITALPGCQLWARREEIKSWAEKEVEGRRSGININMHVVKDQCVLFGGNLLKLFTSANTIPGLRQTRATFLLFYDIPIFKYQNQLFLILRLCGCCEENSYKTVPPCCCYRHHIVF